MTTGCATCTSSRTSMLCVRIFVSCPAIVEKEPRVIDPEQSSWCRLVMNAFDFTTSEAPSG